MILIVRSQFNHEITDGMLSGCKDALHENNIDNKTIKIAEVPGAFDIPGEVYRLIQKYKPSLVITLGCVIKGETDHYHYICDAVSNGIMKLSIESDIPILFGVLTCQNYQLAKDRSGNNMEENKGYELGLMASSMIGK